MTTPSTSTRSQSHRFRHHRLAAASLACLLALPPSLSVQAANIVWAGGSGSWSNGASWIGGSGAGPGSYDDVYIDNANALASAVTFSSSASIWRLYIDSNDSLRVSNGGMLMLSGGLLSNSGTLTVAGTSSGHAYLYTNTDTLLAGSGTTVLTSDPSGYRGTIYGSGKLTVASGHTLRGAGDLGLYYNGLGVINKGTVIAEGGTLNLNTGSTNFDNRAGLVKVGADATLNVSGALWGGTVQSAGSNSKLSGSSFYDVALSGDFEVANFLSLNNASIDGSLSIKSGSLYTSGTISNTGTLTVAGTSSGHTYLYTNTDTLLAGSGTTVLTSNTSGYRGTIYGPGKLTIAAEHTLRGAGDLGLYYSSLGVVNKGTVIAEGGTLNLNTGSTNFDNRAGLVKVAADATLNVSGLLWGGTVQSVGSAGKLSGSSFYDVALSGDFEVAGSLTLNNASIDGSLRVKTASLQTSGTISNTGTLTVAGTSSGHAYMSTSGDTTLSGNGTTVLASDTSGYRGTIYGPGKLTIAAEHTLRGAGDLGLYYSSLGVINKGTVIAEGGTLNLTTGSTGFDNTSGLVKVAADATLNVSGSLRGGTIQSLGSTGKLSGSSFYDVALSGDFEVASSLSLSSVSINGSLRVKTASLQTSGTISNTGTLTVAGTSSGHAYMSTSGDTILSGSGTTVLASDTSGYRGTIYGPGKLTIAAEHTLRGTGDLGLYYSSLGVVNKGTVIAEGGTLNLTTGSTGFDNTAGRVQIANGATLNVSSGTFSGGTIQGFGQGVLAGGTYKDVSLTGGLKVAVGNQASVSGLITNSGTLTLAASNQGYSNLNLAADTTLAGTGTTLLASDTSGYRAVITGHEALTIASDHTLLGAGDLGTYYSSLSVINQGTVVAEGGTLNFYSGTMGFDNTVGVLAAMSDGILSFSGALQLADTSLLRISVTGSANNAHVGQLLLNSTAAFDGRVLLDLSGYSGAAVGDSFTFASYAGSYTGAFDAVSAAGYSFSISYANNQVTATITSVTAVPEPGSWAMLMAGLFAVSTIARRRSTKK